MNLLSRGDYAQLSKNNRHTCSYPFGVVGVFELVANLFGTLMVVRNGTTAFQIVVGPTSFKRFFGVCENFYHFVVG